MATAFSTFDTTPTGAVAAIKAAILASTNWSNPTGDRVVCTTTRGADMVVDLADAAATALRLQFGVYRTAALADKITRYLQWRVSGGATADSLHVTVSAGKEHLFLTVEGPRVGEVNPADSTDGSFRPVFFLCDLVPYFASDTIPVVVCGGSTAASAPVNPTDYLVHVSRNAANTGSWVTSVLETLQPPRYSPQSSNAYRVAGQPLGSGGLIARPWVVFEDVAGIRGRLAQFFNLGWNGSGSQTDFPAQSFGRVTLGSVTYIGLPVNKRAGSLGNSPFAEIGSASAPSPIVAVPYS